MNSGSQEQRYKSRGYEVVVRESGDAVELEVNGTPIDIQLIDGAYFSQTAHSFVSFPTIDALVEELLRNEGKTWRLGDGPAGAPHHHDHGQGGEPS